MTPTPALTQAQYAALKHCLSKGVRIWASATKQGIEGANGFNLSEETFTLLFKQGLIATAEVHAASHHYEPTDTARTLVREYEENTA